MLFDDFGANAKFDRSDEMLVGRAKVQSMRGAAKKAVSAQKSEMGIIWNIMFLAESF